MSSEIRRICEISRFFVISPKKASLCYANSMQLVIVFNVLIDISKYYHKDKLNYNAKNTKENEKKNIA